MNLHTAPIHAYACPICGVPLKPNSRYPNYVCHECGGRAASRDGRRLVFSDVTAASPNLLLISGYCAHYKDDGTECLSHDCWIDGIRCRADEAHFGGIAIEKVADK